MRRLGTICLLLALAAGTTADARSVVPTDEDRAVAVAMRVWRPPCTTIAVIPVPDALYSGWAQTGDCRVWINSTDFEMQAYGPLCTVMLHEVGHIAGHEHSDNPRSVMFGWQVFGRWTDRHGRARWTGVDRRCR